MNELNNILKRYKIIPQEYIKKKNATIIKANNKNYVVKEKKIDNSKILEYLKSRNYNYIPLRIDNENDKYEISEYIDEIDTPKEEKAKDLIFLTSLLHNKTTIYRETIIDDIKEIYENLYSKISYLENYYLDINTIIDDEIFMSPSSYLLARNISLIYASISYCKIELNNWYEIVKKKNKERAAVTHNNLSVDHLIEGKDNNYLVSWSDVKISNPIYDLVSFYKNNYNTVEMSTLLKYYEEKYPLLNEEKKFFFILISIPDKISLGIDEFKNVVEVNKIIKYLKQTDQIISPYYSKNKEQKQNQFNE